MTLAARLLAAAVVGAGAVVAAAGTATAATSCAVMTLQGTTTVALTPSSVTVPAGGCVAFVNQTSLTATFTVGAYSQQVASGDHTSGTRNYHATAAGTTQKVTASELLGSAHGSIVIRAAAKPSPQPSPSHSAAPQPRATPAPTAASATPAGPASPAASTPVLVVPTGSPPPPSSVFSPVPGSSPYLAGRPTPSPSPSTHVAVVGGPLQPPTGRGTGLPAAVAALAVVATAAALVRVLLAEPLGAVDGRARSVGAAL